MVGNGVSPRASSTGACWMPVWARAVYFRFRMGGGTIGQNTPGPEVGFYSLLHIVTLSGQDGLGTEVEVDGDSVKARALCGWVLTLFSVLNL